MDNILVGVTAKHKEWFEKQGNKSEYIRGLIDTDITAHIKPNVVLEDIDLIEAEKQNLEQEARVAHLKHYRELGRELNNTIFQECKDKIHLIDKKLPAKIKFRLQEDILIQYALSNGLIPEVV